MRTIRPSASGTWFKVAVYLLLAQLFLSLCARRSDLGSFLICVSFAVATGWWYVRERRRIRRLERARLFCIHCGYDLRMSRHRCPECGMPVLPWRLW